MSEKNHAELFIHLLAEALEEDRALLRKKLSNQTTTCMGRFKQLLCSDIVASGHTPTAAQCDLPQNITASRGKSRQMP
jgi:hypothetical protein